jgi:protein SCO1
MTALLSLQWTQSTSPLVVVLWLLTQAVSLGRDSAHAHDKACTDVYCAVASTNAFVNGLGASPWHPPAERKKLNFDYKASRHDGQAINLKELQGTPIAISFVYTSCSNPKKCLAVTGQMAELQKRIKEAGLLSNVRVVLITYDPEHDTVESLQQYSAANKLTLDDRTWFLRPDPATSRQLLTELGASASFYSYGVGMHGIKLLLVDKSGALARAYQTVIWSNDEVVKDLRKLVQEP